MLRLNQVVVANYEVYDQSTIVMTPLKEGKRNYDYTLCAKNFVYDHPEIKNKDLKSVVIDLLVVKTSWIKLFKHLRFIEAIKRAVRSTVKLEDVRITKTDHQFTAPNVHLGCTVDPDFSLSRLSITKNKTARPVINSGERQEDREEPARSILLNYVASPITMSETIHEDLATDIIFNLMIACLQKGFTYTKSDEVTVVIDEVDIQNAREFPFYVDYLLQEIRSAIPKSHLIIKTISYK